MRETITQMALTTMLGVGCGSDGVDANGPSRAETAVVLAVLTRNPDDTFQTYLLASEQAPSGSLDLSRALELPDALVAQNEEAIFVGDNERVTLQRYEVNNDFSFTMTGEFSLQSYGVDYINNEPLFFSPTRAYYVDAPRGQVITFNPTSMEITGDIQVPELLREDYVVWLGPSKRVGDRYLANVLYTDENWTALRETSTSRPTDSRASSHWPSYRTSRALGCSACAGERMQWIRTLCSIWASS
jgi:hypothetical protein